MSQTVSVLPDPSNGLVDEFGNGLVTNYAADYFTPTAALAEQTQSAWSIAQWGQPISINSADFSQNNPTRYDPVYGNAVYSWSEPHAASAIAMYQNTAALGGGVVYDLTDGNTTLPPSGGNTEEADMFLSSPGSTSASNANLSHPITLSLNAKIAQSMIKFATPALAQQYATSGTVFGTLDIGLTVNFNGAGGLPAFSGFVQIVPWTSDSPALANYESGPLPTNDPSAQFVSSTLVAGDPALAVLSADAGANPDNLSYNVNQYVYNTLVVAYANFSTAQKAVLLNMANWTLGGVYVGPATNDAQVTNSAGAVSLVAQESVGIQVSAINVTSNLAAAYDPAAPVAAGSEVDTNPQITYYDNTIGAAGSADGSVYNGPLAGIQDKYVYNGADSISLSAPVGVNWEFGGGSGLTELSATSGNNVFVASTGGSTMVGGSGNDIFEVPDANVSLVSTWDTLSNFHLGDTISMAGMGGAGWTYSWALATGPAGAGLTLTATSTITAGLSEHLTLVGLTLADLSSLTITPANNALTIVRTVPVSGIPVTPTLTAAQLAAFSVAQTQALTAAQISSFVGSQVAALPAADIAALSNVQIAALTAAGLSGLTPADMAAITPANIQALSKMQFLAISNADIAAITPAQMHAISALQLSEFAPAQIASLNLRAIAAMTGAQASALGAAQIHALTDAQVGKLSTGILHHFSVFQSQAFSSSQMAAMDRAQRHALI